MFRLFKKRKAEYCAQNKDSEKSERRKRAYKNALVDPAQKADYQNITAFVLIARLL
jgi:hypothetical protein